eukprot:NODE_159_length_3095_cov_43.411844_g148_i0.p1 GENE.NODE_159_length_3095_cov_43.411844_g148_i0~~NODE_159_length_3095_cov_43.411844_g148_i0.p1  ORF type:complete len:941 (+),score=182.51 NODE_159_length_3095_cov_43.411844_g148_i0:114-2936(+)
MMSSSYRRVNSPGPSVRPGAHMRTNSPRVGTAPSANRRSGSATIGARPAVSSGSHEWDIPLTNTNTSGLSASASRTSGSSPPPLAPQCVDVAVRIRPPPVDCPKKSRATRGNEIYRDHGGLVWRWDRQNIQYCESGERTGGHQDKGQEYTFSTVFPMHISTTEVYDAFARRIVQRTFDGFNGCILAYGQTNSGKTHTISGSEHSHGIIPLAAVDFFSLIKQSTGKMFLLRIAFMEVYNEQLKDLLQDRQPNLIIQDDPSRGPAVVNLSEYVVSSLDQVLQLISEGEARRMFGKNNVHEHASRSHTIFQLIVESRNNDDHEVKISTLSIVDLAGSELTTMANEPTTTEVMEQMKESQTIAAQASQIQDKRVTQMRPIREREGANIRKSLLALSRVVNTLARAPHEHIPYRDSKLTRILRSALGGNSNTAVIATINPWMSSMDDKETNATLRFAMTAQQINNHPKMVNVISQKALIDRYQEELRELRTKMLIGEEVGGKLTQLQSEKQQVEAQLGAKLKAKIDEGQALKRQFENLSQFILTAQSLKEKEGAQEGKPSIVIENKRRRRYSFCCLRDPKSMSLFYDKSHLMDRMLDSALAIELAADKKTEALDAVTKTLIQTQKSNIRNLEHENKVMKAERQSKDMLIEKLQEKLQSGTMEQENAERKVKETERALGGNLSQLKQENARLLAEVEALKSSVKRKNQDIDLLSEKLEGRDRENAEMMDRLESASKQIEESRQKADECTKQLDDIREMMANKENQFGRMSSQFESELLRKQADAQQLNQENLEVLREKYGWETYYDNKKKHQAFKGLRKIFGKKKEEPYKPWHRFMPADTSVVQQRYRSRSSPSPRTGPSESEVHSTPPRGQAHQPGLQHSHLQQSPDSQWLTTPTCGPSSSPPPHHPQPLSVAQHQTHTQPRSALQSTQRSFPMPTQPSHGPPLK